MVLGGEGGFGDERLWEIWGGGPTASLTAQPSLVLYAVHTGQEREPTTYLVCLSGQSSTQQAALRRAVEGYFDKRRSARAALASFNTRFLLSASTLERAALGARASRTALLARLTASYRVRRAVRVERGACLFSATCVTVYLLRGLQAHLSLDLTLARHAPFFCVRRRLARTASWALALDIFPNEYWNRCKGLSGALKKATPAKLAGLREWLLHERHWVRKCDRRSAYLHAFS